jgi:hypothetical protein
MLDICHGACFCGQQCGVCVKLFSQYIHYMLHIQLKTPWPESRSELYRPSYRRVSAKLVPTFADRGVSRSQRGGSPTDVFSVF